MDPLEQLKQQVAQLTQQVQGLAAERNGLKVRAEAAETQLSEFQASQFQGAGTRDGGQAGNRPAGAAVGGHPFAPFADLVTGWDPQQVDAYFQGLLGKQGYLTPAQMQEYMGQREQALRQEFMGNIHLFRTVDRTLASPGYKDLATYDSPLAKRTAEILQAKREVDGRPWGTPIEGAKGWDQWQYAGVDVLQTAADIAQAQLFKEGQAAQAATASGQANQAAAALSASPNSGAGAGGGEAGAASGRPDFSQLGSVEDIVGALDAALPASTGP